MTDSTNYEVKNAPEIKTAFTKIIKEDSEFNPLKMFTTIITEDKMKKESEELTKRELENLLTQIKNKPELLQSKIYSDSDSSSESSDFSSSSNSSSSKHKKHVKNNKKKINNDKRKAENIKIYKKECEIDELEKKLYYKTLSLSNMTLDNSKLMTENDNLKNKVKEYELLYNIASSLIDYSYIELFKKIENITQENVLNKRMILEDEFITNKKKLDLINKKFNDISSEQLVKLKKFYQNKTFLLNNMTKNEYEKKSKMIDDFINDVKFNNRIYNIFFISLGGIFLIKIIQYLDLIALFL